LPIKLVLLNNSEIGKISKEQRGVELHVWATSLVNPHFAEFAQSCGGWGKRVSKNSEILAGMQELAEIEGPGILEIITDPMKI
jgi:thiamine pyrophosphate-dependent acetolactate synthase large subunit-like protein